jgi:UDP-N-acetylmuramate dehydrogenase
VKAQERPSLKALNSFGVEASASLLLSIESEEDLLSLPVLDPRRDLLLGGGSNVLLVNDVPGAVFLNRIKGRDIVEDDADFAVIEVGAGENWHELVRWTLERGLCGLENLSLIPGSAGAAPIQNIGAYGVEIASVLQSVTAWDWARTCWTVFSVDECELGYRDSRFKSAEPDRYMITSIRLRLARHFQPCLEYSGLRDELARAGIDKPRAKDVSDAVVRIRRSKLPDPAVCGNAGSFFKNPVVSPERADELITHYPALPRWPDGPARVKLSAAWLIEFCGFKGKRLGDAGVSGQHALVLVNHGSASGLEIATLAREIQQAVQQEFGLQLETEPRLVEFNL